MKKVYVITSMKNGKIFASQETHLMNMGTKKHASIEVTNSGNFEIHEGSRIYIGLPQKKAAIAGIFALFTPITASIVALLASPFAAELLKKECTEPFKAACITLCFSIACAFVLAVSRSTPVVVKLEITSLA